MIPKSSLALRVGLRYTVNEGALGVLGSDVCMGSYLEVRFKETLA